MAEPWHQAICDGDFSAEASVKGRLMEVALSGTADRTVKGTAGPVRAQSARRNPAARAQPG